MAIDNGDVTLKNHALAVTTARALHMALLQLEPDQQRVVTLRLIGLASGEIGLILGKDRAWLDSTLDRAFRRLRALMGVSGM